MGVAADVAEDVGKHERMLNSITGHRDCTAGRLVYEDRERPQVLNKAAETRAKARALGAEGVNADVEPKLVSVASSA